MIKTDITLPIKYTTDDVKCAVCRVLPIGKSEIKDARLLRRSLKLSDTEPPVYRATVAFSLDSERERGLLKIRNRVWEYEKPELCVPVFRSGFRPIVVGAGPAGLFAALALAKSGARPIIIERGDPVDERVKTVGGFLTRGVLDTESNIQFGEGGAGAFSDGKLKTGARDEFNTAVLDEFILSGATDDIAFSDTAHLGTDRLPNIVKAIREKIISLGGEFIFRAKLVDLKTEGESLVAAVYEKDGVKAELPTRAAILATGHSALDTFLMLKRKGLRIEAKGFGIGARIEHPREYINSLVYKDSAEHIEDTASYHLVTHLKSGRSVYSFCMCPGGTVVAASSEQESVVTNGMSEFARMADNSNSALLVSVNPSDFDSSDPLAGFSLQRKIEKRAYEVTGGYSAPAQLLSDFLSGTASSGNSSGSVKPSYPIGVNYGALDAVMPVYVTESLKEGILDFDDWMRGFMLGDAVLTAPETRSTSPVRLVRNEVSREAVGFTGIYPSGEGSGYSGGIVSSATDGLRSAVALIRKYGEVRET